MTTSPASPSPIHVESTGAPALRWGVIGVSDIAVRKVVPAMQAGAVTPVTAIASRSFDRARDAADRLGIVHAFGTYQALLECPDVDVVYISLPNHLHMSWTLAAADAGKHILCEKPLALSSRDARTMVEHCERAGVMLMEAFMYRLHPIWSTTIDLVRQKRIGEVLAVQTVFSYFNEEPSNIRNQVDAGGGALYDVGCYAVDLARWVFDGEPRSVRGAVRHDPRFGTDVLTSALLDFGGRHATFICSTRLEPAQRVELLGTAGRIVIDIPFNISPDQPRDFRWCQVAIHRLRPLSSSSTSNQRTPTECRPRRSHTRSVAGHQHPSRPTEPSETWRSSSASSAMPTPVSPAEQAQFRLSP